MLLVDVDRGKREGLEMAELLEGRRRGKASPANDDGTIRLVEEESGG